MLKRSIFKTLSVALLVGIATPNGESSSTPAPSECNDPSIAQVDNPNTEWVKRK